MARGVIRAHARFVPCSLIHSPEIFEIRLHRGFQRAVTLSRIPAVPPRLMMSASASSSGQRVRVLSELLQSTAARCRYRTLPVSSILAVEHAWLAAALGRRFFGCLQGRKQRAPIAVGMLWVRRDHSASRRFAAHRARAIARDRVKSFARTSGYLSCLRAYASTRAECSRADVRD